MTRAHGGSKKAVHGPRDLKMLKHLKILKTGLPGGSDGKESTYNVGNVGSIPRLGRNPGEGHGNPVQYS